MTRYEPPDGAVEMSGVHEYCEGADVLLVEAVNVIGQKRLAVRAWNQAGYDCTEVDVLDLLAWLRANRPELLA